jgi:hypothetical protein
MNARVLFLLLAVAILLACTRRFRKVGLIMASVLLLLLLWFSARVVNESGSVNNATSSSSSSAAAIARPAAQLSALKLAGNGAPWQLTGSVQNISAATIHSLTISIQRFDCPNATAPLSDCVLLWQGSHVPRITLTSGASARLDERFYSHEEIPRLRGVARDQVDLTAVD